MQVTTQINGEIKEFRVRTYMMPKKGNAPDGFHLYVNGEKVVAMTTGGGKHPRYTYFQLVEGGTGYYFDKDVMPESGTKFDIKAEQAVVATPVESKAEAAEPVVTKSRGKKAVAA